MQITHRKYRGGAKTVKALIVLLLAFSPYLWDGRSLYAQIVVPKTMGISVSEAAFNKEFIRKNKIRTITASVVDKPDGEIIRDKGLAQVYLFDTTGNLTRHYFNEITSLVKTETEIPAMYKRGTMVKKAKTKIDFQYQYDTLGTEYHYTSSGFPIMKRVCIGDFYNTTYYEYFGDGLVSRQTLCKETNVSIPGEQFKLGVQTVLSEEKFEYENLTPTQVKMRYLNDEGKAYKQGILNFKDGKPIDESYQFVVGFIRSGVNYSYDDKGRLIEKTTTDNSSGLNVEKTTYEYDGLGNVMAEKKFKNGTHTNEVIYLYDAEKKLLNSQLDRQIIQTSIKIVKYEYTFY